MAQVTSLTDPILLKQDLKVVSQQLLLCIKQKSGSAPSERGTSGRRCEQQPVMTFKKINPLRLKADYLLSVEKRTKEPEKQF